jgi:hypothetical protein
VKVACITEPSRAVAADTCDGGIPEQRDVKIHRLFATTLEHQEGFDFLGHGHSLKA